MNPLAAQVVLQNFIIIPSFYALSLIELYKCKRNERVCVWPILLDGWTRRS